MSQPSITCPVCRRTSYNPRDVITGYCAHCHRMQLRRAHRLYVLRWSIIFFGVLGLMFWSWIAADPPWWVSSTMGGLWGWGVGRMMISDRDRMLRKLMAWPVRESQR